jgi:pimeloyl-ACP methyl ester carboxylesterase
MSEKSISCKGITINYIDEGTGDPIVFLHNGGGFLQIWTRQIDFFKNNYRVIAPDLPGFGESDESGESYTLEFYFEIFKEFFQLMKLDDFILVGNCIGSSIAVKYKKAYPNRGKNYKTGVYEVLPV